MKEEKTLNGNITMVGKVLLWVAGGLVAAGVLYQSFCQTTRDVKDLEGMAATNRVEINQNTIKITRLEERIINLNQKMDEVVANQKLMFATQNEILREVRK